MHTLFLAAYVNDRLSLTNPAQRTFLTFVPAGTLTGVNGLHVQQDLRVIPLRQGGIGGQENQLYLTRGEWLAKVTRIDKVIRTKFLPVSFGFPFGLSAVLPVNVPLPTKIVTQVLKISLEFDTFLMVEKV